MAAHRTTWLGLCSSKAGESGEGGESHREIQTETAEKFSEMFENLSAALGLKTQCPLVLSRKKCEVLSRILSSFVFRRDFRGPAERDLLIDLTANAGSAR
jgi:hypothetical protein